MSVINGTLIRVTADGFRLEDVTIPEVNDEEVGGHWVLDPGYRTMSLDLEIKTPRPEVLALPFGLPVKFFRPRPRLRAVPNGHEYRRRTLRR